MINKKNIFKLLLGIWLGWTLTYFLIDIKLNGEKQCLLKNGEDYRELGATASFLGVPLKVKIKGKIINNGLQKQKVVYETRSFLGIKRLKFRYIKIVDKIKPVIKLKGKALEKIFLGESYTDPFVTATDDIDGDLTKIVKTSNNINFKKIGLYHINYQVKDKSGNVATADRMVSISNRNLTYDIKYNSLSNEDTGWWSNNKKDLSRPIGSFPNLLYKKYGAYFIGENEKIIYLTFDEGSNDTYLDKIVEVLDQENIKGTFFLCGNYMKENKELVKKWSDSGHSIGNHTYYHKNMALFATKEQFKNFIDEIISMEALYKEITGKPMMRLFRFPEGQWSMRSLAIMDALGYKTYFWSASYLDFLEDLTKQEAFTKIMELRHNGAIYLLHPKNKGNYEALSSFIKEMKGQGYTFGLVKDISDDFPL